MFKKLSFALAITILVGVMAFSGAWACPECFTSGQNQTECVAGELPGAHCPTVTHSGTPGVSPTGHCPAGTAPNNQLYLFGKDPSTGQVLDGGAWGKMTHNLWGSALKFNFKGYGLKPSTGYTLVYCPDPFPGHNLICLGSGVTDVSGNLSLKGTKNTAGDLPKPFDANKGAKICLVLTTDVVQSGTPHMSKWNAGEYLMPHNHINFHDTNN